MQIQSNGNFQKTIRTKPPAQAQGKPAHTGKQWKRTDKRAQHGQE